MMIFGLHKELIFPALVLATTLSAACTRTSPIIESSRQRIPLMAQQAEVVETKALAEVDGIINKGIEQKTYPGAVLVIGHKGETLWAKPYGHFTYEESAPEVTLDTIYDLASVSKVVGTATMALSLIGEGKLQLSDPVSKYIPGFEEHGKDEVTIRHLMTHISGLKAYESVSVVERDRPQAESKADALIRHYAGLKPTNPPGEKYVYSCLNFQTLARVNEAASGMRMEDYLREKIYGPLRMKDSVYLLTDEQKQRIAPPFRVSEDVPIGRVHDPIASYHGSDQHCPGNAGLFSTAPDLQRYCEMILNEGRAGDKQLLPAEVVRTATTNHLAPSLDELQGLGFDVIERPNWRTELNDSPESYIIGHTGYTGTLIWMDKKSGAYFVLLTNRTYPSERGEAPAAEIAAIRGEIAQVLLRSLPDYSEYFAAKATQENAAPGGK